MDFLYHIVSISISFSQFQLNNHLNKSADDEVPSALAEAMPNFVQLGLILPEGFDAMALNKAPVARGTTLLSPGIGHWENKGLSHVIYEPIVHFSVNL